MATNAIKNLASGRKRRRLRVRAKVSGTSARPRLVAFRSLKHIHAQVIDDATQATLVAASDREISSRSTPTENAKQVGALIAKKALEKNISQVVFDRRGYQYHGRIRALADGAREGGLKF